MKLPPLPSLFALSALAFVAVACSRVPLLSYGAADVYISALSAPPSITPVGGGSYALHVPPLAGPTPVSVLPRLKVSKGQAIVTGHMTFEPQTGPFEITLRGAQAQPGAVSFVWQDPDGVRHPIGIASAAGRQPIDAALPPLDASETPLIEDLPRPTEP